MLSPSKITYQPQPRRVSSGGPKSHWCGQRRLSRRDGPQMEVLKDKSDKEEREEIARQRAPSCEKTGHAQALWVLWYGPASSGMTLPGDWVAEKIRTTRLTRGYWGILSGRHNCINLFEAVNQSSLNLWINGYHNLLEVFSKQPSLFLRLLFQSTLQPLPSPCSRDLTLSRAKPAPYPPGRAAVRSSDQGSLTFTGIHTTWGLC